MTTRNSEASTRSRARIVGSLLAVGVVGLLSRAYIFGSVFRKDDVVLLANDPYWYRVLVERTLARAGSVLDVVSFVAAVIHPDGAIRDPLMVLVLSWAAELVGGDPHAAGIVLAWYPVVAALLTIGLVYAITRRLTADHWTALTAAGLLAITPVHVFRTALGIADHHAGDYVWLALTVCCLVWLAEADDIRSLARWLLAAGFALGVVGQVTWWVGGLLFVVPVGVYVVVRTLSDVRAGESPLRENATLVAGLGVATALVVLARPLLNQAPVDIRLHIYVLLIGLLLAGAVGVVLFAEVVYRADWPVSVLAAGEIAGFVATAWLLSVTVVDVRHVQQVLHLLSPLWAWTTVAEVVSLFGGQFGPLTGPWALYGLLLFIAVPYLCLATWTTYRDHRPAWLVLVVYTWYFLALAAFQRRFAGPLAPFVAVFAAIGLVDVATRLGVVHEFTRFGTRLRRHEEYPPRLNTDQAFPEIYLLSIVLFLVVTASFVQIPIKMNQVTIDGDEHDAARAMRATALESGLSDTKNDVLSPWGQHRMYNYFVSSTAVTGTSATENGQPLQWSRRNYYPFLIATDGEEWYSNLVRNGMGFVVTRDRAIDFHEATLQHRLHQHYGSRHGTTPGVAQYRAVYAAPDGSPKAFVLVPGAKVVGQAPPDTTVTLATVVEIPGASFTYRRTTQANASGRYTVTVPYPGRYTGAKTTTTVPEAAVFNGQTVSVPAAEDRAARLPGAPLG